MAKRKTFSGELEGIANALVATAKEREEADDFGTAEELHNVADRLRELEAFWKGDERLLADVQEGKSLPHEHKLLTFGEHPRATASEDDMARSLDEHALDGWSVMNVFFDPMGKPPWRVLLRRERIE